MSRPDESRPSRGRKHFTSIQKQSHDPNHIALGRDRSFGLPQRPQFPQGPNKPNTDHPNNPTSSHSARTQPGSGPQPPSQPLQNALHRGDKSSFITLKTDRAPYRSDTKVTENTRLQLETDRWPPQEHEKFCELMMKEWSQATVISDPYRRKAEEVFPDVAKLMAQFGYQRDKEDCYLYWYHVARHESSFKYTLNYPTPPVRENRSLQRMVEDKPVQQLNNSKPKAPISNNTTSTNQRLSNPAKPLERARADARKSTPKPSEKTRADARKAVEEIHKTPYKSDATPGGGSVLIMIPNELVPLIVGRGGETLTNMEKSIGCHISTGYEDKCVNGLRPVTIYGTVEATSQAKNRVAEILTSTYREETNFMVPENKVHIILGLEGRTMKQLRRTTGCKNIWVERNSINGLRPITFLGSIDEISHAKRLIMEMISPTGLEIVAPIQSRKNTSEANAARSGPDIAAPIQSKNNVPETNSTRSGLDIIAPIQSEKNTSETDHTRPDLEIAAPIQSKKTVSGTNSTRPGLEIVALNQSKKTPSKTGQTQPLLHNSDRQDMADSDSDDCEIISVTPRTVSRPPSTPQSSAQQHRRSDNKVPMPARNTPRPRADNPPISRPLNSNGWSVRETKILHEAVEDRRQIEFSKHISHQRLSLNDDQLWIYISRRVDEAGFKRNAESCRIEWEKTFHSPFGLVVRRLDEPDEENESNMNEFMIPDIDPGAPIEGYDKPANGPWSNQEMWDVDALLNEHKGVSFTQEGPKVILNFGLSWEGITQLHNKNGWSRSTNSVMNMWNSVRGRKTALPPPLKNRTTKRLHPVDDDNEAGSANQAKRPRRLQPPAEQSSNNGSFRLEDFNNKIRKLQQDIADIEKKKSTSEKAVEESDEKLAQLELEKQAIHINKNKSVDEIAGHSAEINELKEKMEAMQTAMNMFFG